MYCKKETEGKNMHSLCSCCQCCSCLLSVLFLLTLSFVAVAVIFTVYEATAQHTVLTAIMYYRDHHYDLNRVFAFTKMC